MSVDFVNRINELKIVYNMVHGSSPERVLFFYGEGGLGKTRLLQELPSHLHKNNINITCPDIINFDDMSFRVIDNLVRILIQRLPDITKKDRDSVNEALELFYDMEKAGDSQKNRNRQGRRIIQDLANIVNKFHETGKPVLLRFDTIEKMEPGIHEPMIQFIHELKDAFVVISGRMEKNAPDFWNNLRERIASNNISSHELRPLSFDAQKEYLNAKIRKQHIELQPQEVELLLKLSRGRPILIDLAIEYFARATEIEEDLIREKSNTGQLNLSSEQEKEFERRLVRFVTAVRSNMERLILILSRVYPLSSTMIAEMLKLTQEEAADLLEEAQTYVFIKHITGYDGSIKITLHDEFRRMVLAYVWPDLDESFKRRKRDSRRARDMFFRQSNSLRQHINKLKPQIRKPHSRETYSKYLTLIREREIVTEEQLRHALYTDFSTGFTEWQTIVDKIRFGRKYSFVDRLCRLVSSYVEPTEDASSEIPLDAQPTEQQHYDYYFIKARSHQDLGQLDEAEKRYKTLLNDAVKEGNEKRERQIANMLGVLKRDQGEYDEAVDYQEQCLALLPKDDYWAIANVENSIGYIYLLQKDQAWKYLEMARQRFETARKTALKAFPDANLERKIGIKNLIAAIKNNLGYIYGLNKEFGRGEKYCKDAIEIWEEIGRAVEIAWAKINLGVMARDRRQYQHAIQRLNEAISLLDPRDNFQELCNAHLQLGWTQWFMAAIDSNKESSLAKLEEARRNLEKSLRFALDHEYNPELPDVYHQLASVYWELSKRQDDPEKKLEFQEKARKTNEKSIKWCKKLNNIRYFVDAWIGEMEFDYDIENDNQLEKHLNILKPYKDYNFPLYWGRVKRIQGDWAWRRGDLDTAFTYYGEGIPLINSHGGYGPYKIEIELANLADKLKQLSVEEGEKYLKFLDSAWKDEKGWFDLDFWIEDQLDQIHILEIGQRDAATK